MRGFIKYILIWFFTVFVLLEFTLRLFDLSANTMPTTSLNNDYVFKPNSSGTWIRGGLAELKNYYSINNLGYNSSINYNDLSENDLNIALIGDSYIQGFQTDVRNSIGRQLEGIINPNKTVVHEFGRAGANIVDYHKVYKQFIQPKNYDFVFILITDKDLERYKPSYMNRGDRVPKKDFTRKIYDLSYVLRYLNINQGIGTHFSKLISNGPESFERIAQEKSIKSETSKKEYINRINLEIINKIPDDIIFIHEKEKLSDYFIDNFNFNFVEIRHDLQPFNHGFDSHWNFNGRRNCATSIARYIRQNPKRASQPNKGVDL